jgi:hypothetical protein
MKTNYHNIREKDELDILTDDINLDPREMYVLGFLKGFDRAVLKEWSKKGLIDISFPVI